MEGPLVCHVVGNGESRNLWNPADHRSEMSIGCNRYEGCRLAVVYDCKVVNEVAASSYRINRPVILGQNASQEASMQKEFWRKTVVVGEVKLPPKGTGMRLLNAGHNAIAWALRSSYDEIHLWGFDSLWADTRGSDSDHHWKRGETLANAPRSWEKSWQNLFAVYSKVVLLVHAPPGATLRHPQFKQHFRFL